MTVPDTCLNPVASKEMLREKIIRSLEAQGFLTNPHPHPDGNSKEVYRLLQEKARLERVKEHHGFLVKHVGIASKFLRDSADINPEKIELKLREVESDSLQEKLYRWWNFIWWSIPYERSYGRQLRFLLWDVTHDAPFGLIGLHSPPLRMAVRDNFLGISKETRDWWVNMSLSAQRVGALPPYNELLGGRMVALSLTANEIRGAYSQRYENSSSIIRGRRLPANLLFVTTTAAFGKSSLYNRLKYKDQPVVEFLGYSQGSGAFHISEALYEEILDFLGNEGVNVERGYGHGSSRKRQLLNKAFRMLGLSSFEYHGIKRGFYLFAHVKNLRDVIQNEVSPDWYDRPFCKLASYWRERWCVPRAERVPQWRNFQAKQFIEDVEKTLKEIQVARF